MVQFGGQTNVGASLAQRAFNILSSPVYPEYVCLFVCWLVLVLVFVYWCFVCVGHLASLYLIVFIKPRVNFGDFCSIYGLEKSGR